MNILCHLSIASNQDKVSPWPLPQSPRSCVCVHTSILSCICSQITQSWRWVQFALFFSRSGWLVLGECGGVCPPVETADGGAVGTLLGANVPDPKSAAGTALFSTATNCLPFICFLFPFAFSSSVSLVFCFLSFTVCQFFPPPELFFVSLPRASGVPGHLERHS